MHWKLDNQQEDRIIAILKCMNNYANIDPV
jgi:hypothetical protein